MQQLNIKTSENKQVLDITREIENALEGDGVCSIFLTHTTAAITTADLDPGTDLDMLDAIDAIMPKLNYRHPHNPEHAPDHIASSIIGTSLNIPFKNGELMLGTWQRVVLVELDGPRERNIIISF